MKDQLKFHPGQILTLLVASSSGAGLALTIISHLASDISQVTGGTLNIRPGHTVEHCAQYCKQWLNCIVYLQHCAQQFQGQVQKLQQKLVGTTRCTIARNNFHECPLSATSRTMVKLNCQFLAQKHNGSQRNDPGWSSTGIPLCVQIKLNLFSNTVALGVLVVNALN